MHWLDKKSFRNETASYKALPGPQLLRFKLGGLRPERDIPIAPEDSSNDVGFPGKVSRWYGRIEKRYLILDVYSRRLGERDENEATLETCFPLSPAHNYDWMTLLELAGLPESIDAAILMFVQSRATQPSDVLYVRDDRGFDCPVYFAQRDYEAAGFLEYLEAARRPGEYFIGSPEHNAEWIIVRLSKSGETTAARYWERSSTVSTACRMSIESGDRFRVACADKAVDARVYIVSEGRVESTYQ